MYSSLLSFSEYFYLAKLIKEKYFLRLTCLRQIKSSG